MPMHNVAAWVGPAIRSILDQTWRDLELIIVDDCSDDASGRIAEAACHGDARVRFVRQPRQQGQSAARNRGLELACGSYIYLFDSDDLLEPDTLATCMQRIKQDDLDFVTFSGTAFDDETGAAIQAREFRKPNLPMPQPGQDLFVALLRQKSFSSSCCLYVFARSLLDETALHFDEGYLHEDEAFTTILYCTSHRSIAMSAPFFRRRFRSGSTMTKPRGLSNVSGCVKAATRLAEYRRRCGESLSQACHQALRRRQKSVMRQATINALLCRNSVQLLTMLLGQIGLRQIARIDPLLPAFYGWCLLQRAFGRLR